MTPLERARARLAEAAPPADVVERDVKPPNVTVTVILSPLLEMVATARRVDEALVAAGHEPGDLLPRTEATRAAEAQLDQVVPEVLAGRAPRAELERVLVAYEGAWLVAARSKRRRP
jgi:hypothetical protein